MELPVGHPVKDHGPLPRLQDGGPGNQEGFLHRPTLDLHLCVHSGFDPEIGVGQLQADPTRPGGPGHRGIDVADGSVKGLTGIGLEADHPMLAFTDQGEFLLEDLRLHPDPAQIGDAVEVRPGGYARPLHHVLLHHDPAGRRPERQRLRHGAPLLHSPDLLPGDFPVGQPAASRVHQLLGTLRRPLASPDPGLFQEIQGQEQLLLGGDQRGTVDLHEGLACTNRSPGEVHHEALHPSVDPGTHRSQAGFVIGDQTHRLNRGLQGPPGDRGVGDADPVGGIGIQAHRLGFVGPGRHG